MAVFLVKMMLMQVSITYICTHWVKARYFRSISQLPFAQNSNVRLVAINTYPTRELRNNSIRDICIYMTFSVNACMYVCIITSFYSSSGHLYRLIRWKSPFILFFQTTITLTNLTLVITFIFWSMLSLACYERPLDSTTRTTRSTRFNQERIKRL